MASSNAPTNIFHSRLKKQARTRRLTTQLGRDLLFLNASRLSRNIVGLAPARFLVAEAVLKRHCAGCPMRLANERASYFGPRTDATGLLKLGATCVLCAILFAPSIWMLTVIPPLWRDVDAYLQVTRPPGPETILQYGPLYCWLARIE